MPAIGQSKSPPTQTRPPPSRQVLVLESRLGTCSVWGVTQCLIVCTQRFTHGQCGRGDTAVGTRERRATLRHASTLFESRGCPALAALARARRFGRHNRFPFRRLLSYRF